MTLRRARPGLLDEFAPSRRLEVFAVLDRAAGNLDAISGEIGLEEDQQLAAPGRVDHDLAAEADREAPSACRLLSLMPWLPCGRSRSSGRPSGRAASAAGPARRARRARPSASRSAPAQAIIAPLSVQSASGGATRRKPRAASSVSSPALSALLAATPPATTSVGVAISGNSARKRSSAWPMRSRDHRRHRAPGRRRRDRRHRRSDKRRDRLGRMAQRRLQAGEGKIGAGPAEHRARQREAVGIARAPRRVRPPGRPDRAGRAASPSCRRPRRARRRSSCPSAHSRRRRAPAGSAYGRPRPAAADRERRCRRSAAPSAHGLRGD